MKKAIVCILALALVLAASLALADQKITLMLGNSQADSHPWNRAIEDMIRLADEYSDGRIEIINYPNATLGNENEMFESMMLRQGAGAVLPAVPFPQLRALGSGSGWRNRPGFLQPDSGKDRLSQDHGLLGRFHPQCAGCQSAGTQH